MNIYAIGDLHLSAASDKPMNVFGGHWDNHWQRIQQSWRNAVSQDDIVLLPGDHSWAMRLEEAREDIAQICAMPGNKVLIKGNHDYWWSSHSKVKSLLSNQTYALQNNAYIFGDYVIAGTRGWLCPQNKQYDSDSDEKLYLREAARLELSLSEARKTAPDAQLIGMMHYPPSNSEGSPSLFTELFEKYGASHVVYGHLHSASVEGALSGNLRGICYTLVSCDAINFQPIRIV